MQVISFTFNPFQENTYVLIDNEENCLIVDPGCHEKYEEDELIDFISSENLTPLAILQTHAHIDHILGTAKMQDHYKLDTYLHDGDNLWYSQAKMSGDRWGIQVTQPDPATHQLKHGDEIRLGNFDLEVRFTPGHAPGHVVFIDHKTKQVIGGDVLFKGSIGRTDLPMCNHDDLITSIKEQLFTLEDDYQVHPGHGPSTTIGEEKATNPFLQ